MGDNHLFIYKFGAGCKNYSQEKVRRVVSADVCYYILTPELKDLYISDLSFAVKVNKFIQDGLIKNVLNEEEYIIYTSINPKLVEKL